MLGSPTCSLGSEVVLNFILVTSEVLEIEFSNNIRLKDQGFLTLLKPLLNMTAIAQRLKLQRQFGLGPRTFLTILYIHMIILL